MTPGRVLVYFRMGNLREHECTISLKALPKLSYSVGWNQLQQLPTSNIVACSRGAHALEGGLGIRSNKLFNQSRASAVNAGLQI